MALVYGFVQRSPSAGMLPKELAGDVGSLRGTTNNLASARGVSLLAIIPAESLPNYIPGEVPDPSVKR